MSADPDDDAITSAGDFEAAMGDLLVAAIRNGVDIRGSWVYNLDDGHDNWELMIYELE